MIIKFKKCLKKSKFLVRKKFTFGLFFLLLTPLSLFSQYAPPVGYFGTTAIHKDSSCFKSWAASCKVQRGSVDISDNPDSLASYGNDEAACGVPDNMVVSLGDGGIATLRFNPPISNGTGFDFAIFENSFNDNFLELAFVEVSSDSINYHRFHAISLTQTSQQTGAFDTLDTRQLHNLAGKYRSGYGTPFDLEELRGACALNVKAISHMRIIDVVGSINPDYGTKDSQGNYINDPWPTPFNSCGFDLDAVGVIHNNTSNILSLTTKNILSIYPNPAQEKITISMFEKTMKSIVITNISGKEILFMQPNTDEISILTESFSKGFYFLKIKTEHEFFYEKIIVQ